MNIVPLPAPARRHPLGPAQKNALLRWHGPARQGEILKVLNTQPHFPVINTGGTPRPDRRRPRPAPKGGPGNAA